MRFQHPSFEQCPDRNEILYMGNRIAVGAEFGKRPETIAVEGLDEPFGRIGHIVPLETKSFRHPAGDGHFKTIAAAISEADHIPQAELPAQTGQQPRIIAAAQRNGHLTSGRNRKKHPAESRFQRAKSRFEKHFPVEVRLIVNVFVIYRASEKGGLRTEFDILAQVDRTDSPKKRVVPCYVTDREQFGQRHIIDLLRNIGTPDQQCG